MALVTHTLCRPFNEHEFRKYGIPKNQNLDQSQQQQEQEQVQDQFEDKRIPSNMFETMSLTLLTVISATLLQASRPFSDTFELVFSLLVLVPTVLLFIFICWMQRLKLYKLIERGKAWYRERRGTSNPPSPYASRVQSPYPEFPLSMSMHSHSKAPRSPSKSASSPEPASVDVPNSPLSDSQLAAMSEIPPLEYGDHPETPHRIEKIFIS